MAKGHSNYDTTCLCFNLEDYKERFCYEFFKNNGRRWKPFVLTYLTYRFPDYYEDGIIADKLEYLIQKYAKDFDKQHYDNPVFLGWHYLRYDLDCKTSDLLNRHLRGGAKDFIVQMITDVLWV